MVEVDTTPLETKENTPDWLLIDEKSKVRIDELKLSEEVLKDTPVMGVPFNDRTRYYYKYDRDTWTRVTKQTAHDYLKRTALEKLDQYGVYSVRRMNVVSKTALILAYREHNPFIQK